MLLAKRLNKQGVYRLLKPVLVSKHIDQHKVYSFYDSIKTQRKENGRYMIKRHETKSFNYSFNKLAYGKCYFCYADRGICHTYSRKDKNIFYLNNFNKMLRLAKYLAASDHTYLYCVVDRVTDKSTYVMLEPYYKSEVSRNDILFVK